MNQVLHPARYSDGRTAAIHAVRVSLQSGTLTILAESGSWLDVWAADDIRLVGKPDADGTARYCLSGGDARLTVQDPELVRRLAAEAINLRQPYTPGHVRSPRLLLWTIGAVVSLAAFFILGVPYFAREISQLVPAPVETRLGTTAIEPIVKLLADPEPARQGKAICANPQGQAALARLAARLEAAAAIPFPVIVRAVNSRHRNAFALPGGQILILRGLLEFMRDPNELAAVLAHEIAHAEHRHPLQITIQRTSGSFVVGLLFGDAVTFSVAGTAASLLLQGYYSREMEGEADERGLALMRAAGLDTAGMAEFFARLTTVEGRQASGILSILSTHPDTAERATRARAAPGGGGRGLSPSDWQAVRAICQ